MQINPAVEQKFVTEFKYLGHIILHDFRDIDRKIRNMFFRAMVHKFGKCSASVKITLFKSYCLNMYDSALWYHYTSTTLNRQLTCYNKCIKTLFSYNKRFSVTQMLGLLELRLPSFAQWVSPRQDYLMGVRGFDPRKR